ncbi:MAG: c-type cytochrome [Rhodanobacter sp.]|nr:MAG: c-type cytochrome [Rhodanobacter sp.]TAM13719.1 MAG: c-type cytochrome [Rhodanobacter sp.]TAM35195.1 MAG: c-type cytochrome [Rhodanobacter sp.]
MKPAPRIALIALAMVIVPWAARSSGQASRTTAAPAATKPAAAALPAFTPPPDSAIPDDPFGALVREGRDIFLDTPGHAKPYVGNGLSCSNCHLDAGRRANSAPMWAAYVRYPRYRAKNGKVNTFADRLRGCFQFSMNGKAPAADSDVIRALTAYSYWLATGAPTGKNLAGYGYPKEGFTSPLPPSYARGQQVYASHCALCHGTNGEGQQVAGKFVFPPLWGPQSFNWGAGMGNIDNAAAFIKANMPFSRGDTLTDQDAWDVAMFMDAHERPQDPRFKDSVAATRKQHHDSKWSLYGTEVNGRLVGTGTPPRGR